MMELKNYSKLIIRQRRELFELIGFETRNKYEICDADKNVIGFCAEQNKGILGFLFRQFLGHWRSFEIHFYDFTIINTKFKVNKFIIYVQLKTLKRLPSLFGRVPSP